MKNKIKHFLYKLKFTRSLKLRIFLLLIMAGAIPAVLIHISILQSYEKHAITLRTSDVSNQLKIISNHLVSKNYLYDPSSEAINAQIEQISNLYDGRVMIIDNHFKIIKDTYNISEGKTVISEEVIKCFKGENTAHYDDVNGYIEITTPIILSIKDENGKKTENISGVMLTSVSTDYVENTKIILNRKAQLIEWIMLLIIFGMALLLSNILVKPFERVTEAIAATKAGYTDEPISVPDYLETEHIIDAFNELNKRMKVLDDSRQEFVSNVSHELKTPITSVKILADSLNAQKDVPIEIYQEFMQDITHEIDRENQIITDLLSLVKLDKTSQDLTVTHCDINGMIEAILKRLGPIAAQKEVTLVFESNCQVSADVDEVKMNLVLTNLIENAIKYNKDAGKVHVLLDADHQFFTVEVKDTGIGIPEDSIEHIFERFYRVDKSHSREIGGTGLGLAIARGAVLLHRGSIKAYSEVGEGTTFTIKIPLIYKETREQNG